MTFPRDLINRLAARDHPKPASHPIKTDS